MPEIDDGRLRSKKEKVLSVWEARSLKEIPSAHLSGSLVLRNSLPIYLDHLSEALAANRKMDRISVARHDDESIRIGKLHGADRAGNTSYMLTELISEYHILREVIFQVLEEDGQMPANLRDIVLDSIEQAVNDAAVQFSEVHSDIQEKFIHTLTHDLKTPISAAKFTVQLLLREKEADRHPILAKRVIASLDRLAAMIHNLLDAGRVRAGEALSLQYSECDLAEVVQEVVLDLSLIHGDRFIFASEGSFAGEWGREGVQRAIENLLGNAVKYGSEEKPITVTLKSESGAAHICVHNEGNPIPEADIPLLFQQYRRTKSAENSVNAGWGLGLTVTKGVVDAHRGEIHVQSSKTHGTDFILKLPVQRKNSDKRS